MKLSALTLAAALSSCASAPSNSQGAYQFYVLKTETGILNGRDPKGKDDLPISICADTKESAANCYVIRRDEYLKLKQDLVELYVRVQACERVPAQALLQ